MDDDFVPEGCVPLKSATERLAEARQMNVPSAQAELRGKLYSRSIAAQAIERKTGRMFDIIPEAWATEAAYNWFDTGTCLLPDENGKVRITRERFGFLYGPERATIFIFENDLRHLIGPAVTSNSDRPVTSDAEAKRQFDKWRKSRGEDVPSLKEDVDHMRQFGVSRDRVREFRKGVGVSNRPRGGTSRPRGRQK